MPRPDDEAPPGEEPSDLTLNLPDLPPISAPEADRTWESYFPQVEDWMLDEAAEYESRIIEEGIREQVEGRPVVENPAMEAVASASKSVLFGDMSRYCGRRVSPTRAELSKDYKFDTDQVALKVVERLDGALVDTAAVKYLVPGQHLSRWQRPRPQRDGAYGPAGGTLLPSPARLSLL